MKKLQDDGKVIYQGAKKGGGYWTAKNKFR
jgi:hypothetical protein